MQACDDLYVRSPADSAYEAYGDSCAGRQSADSGQFCAGVFTDTAANPTPTTVGPAGSAPTSTEVYIPESVMFGSGTGTGPVVAACPVGQHLNREAVSSCLANSTPLPPGTVELAIDADCPVEGDLEHPDSSNEEVFTFTEPAQMKTLLECILPEAVAWISWEYGGLDVPTEWAGSQAASLLPNHFLYVPTGVRVTDYMDTCQGEDEQGEYSYGDHDLAYCPIDGDIYIGEAQLWEDYHNHGDADVWGTISHEMGHRIQHVAGLPTSRTDNEQIPYENQADCFSGAFLDYSARQTPLNAPSTGDDLIDLFVGLFNIGDPRIGEDDQDHGSIDQRIRAFFVGYNSLDAQGAWACDFYVPGIIPPSRTNQSTAASTTAAS